MCGADTLILDQVKDGERQMIVRNGRGQYELVSEFGERRVVSKAYVESRRYDAGHRSYGAHPVQGGLPELGKRR